MNGFTKSDLLIRLLLRERQEILLASLFLPIGTNEPDRITSQFRAEVFEWRSQRGYWHNLAGRQFLFEV